MIQASFVDGKLLNDEGQNVLPTKITFINRQQAETYVKAHNLSITIR